MLTSGWSQTNGQKNQPKHKSKDDVELYFKIWEIKKLVNVAVNTVAAERPADFRNALCSALTNPDIMTTAPPSAENSTVEEAEKAKEYLMAHQADTLLADVLSQLAVSMPANPAEATPNKPVTANMPKDEKAWGGGKGKGSGNRQGSSTNVDSPEEGWGTKVPSAGQTPNLQQYSGASRQVGETQEGSPRRQQYQPSPPAKKRSQPPRPQSRPTYQRLHTSGHSSMDSDAQNSAAAGELEKPHLDTLVFVPSGSSAGNLAMELINLQSDKVAESNRQLVYHEGMAFITRAARGEAVPVAFKEFPYKRDCPWTVEREIWYKDSQEMSYMDKTKTRYVVMHLHFADEWDAAKQRKRQHQTADWITQLNLRHYTQVKAETGTGSFPTMFEGAFLEGKGLPVCQEDNDSGVLIFKVGGKGGWRWNGQKDIQKLHDLQMALPRLKKEGGDIDQKMQCMGLRHDKLVQWFPGDPVLQLEGRGGYDKTSPLDPCDLVCEALSEAQKALQSTISVEMLDVWKESQGSQIGVEVLSLGNDDYAVQGLKNLRNCVSDAKAISELFEGFGACCTLKSNLGFPHQFRIALTDWKRRLAQLYQPGKLRIAVFFYAGHGIFNNNTLYMVPTFSGGGNPALKDLRIEADFLSMSSVWEEIKDEAVLQDTSVLFIFDCCRSVGNGIQSMSQSKMAGTVDSFGRLGVEVWFSTGLGDIASDGTGNNSPFVQSMLRNLKGDSLLQLAFGKICEDFVSSQRVPYEQVPDRAGVLFGVHSTISGSQIPKSVQDVPQSDASKLDVGVSKAKPGVFVYVMLQPPPVLSGRVKHRFELLDLHRKMPAEFAKNHEKDLKKSQPVILSDGDRTTVLKDLVKCDTKLQVLIWSALGREWSQQRMDGEQDPFQSDEEGLQWIKDRKHGPHVVVVCHTYGAASTAAEFYKIDRVVAVIFLKHQLLHQDGVRLYFDVVLPVLWEIECGTSSERDIMLRMGRSVRKFFGLQEDSPEQWGVRMKCGLACPQWKQEPNGIQDMVRVSMNCSGQLSVSNLHRAVSKSQELDDLHVRDICTVSSLVKLIKDGLQSDHKVTKLHIFPRENDPRENDFSRSRCVVNDVCFCLLGSSDCNVVWRIAENADWQRLMDELGSKPDLRAVLWIDIVDREHAMSNGLASRLTCFCKETTQTVLLLTSIKDCIDLADEISEECDFEDWRFETVERMSAEMDILSTSIAADSLHGEIKVFIKDGPGHSAMKCTPLEVISATEFVHIFGQALPPGFQCPVAGLYADDDQSLLVRIGFSCVGLVHRLRDEILMGFLQIKLTKSLHEISGKKHFVVEVDCSSFAKLYEQSILELDKLTPHQEQKLRESNCKEGDVHLRAPAGAGKTFVALHRILLILSGSPDAIVLFVAKNETLVMFVARWVYERLKKSGAGTKKRKKIFERLHVLYMSEEAASSSMHESFESVMMYGPSIVTFLEIADCGDELLSTQKCNKADEYALIILDEAHHLFCHADVVIALQGYSGPKLLLSDLSQGIEFNIAYPPADHTIDLMEVVRSSKRIVSGAKAFQHVKDISCLTQCHHTASGPPLCSLLFHVDTEKETLFQCYARHVVKALRFRVISRFPTLDLDNRLAIIVPDEAFRVQLVSCLEKSFDESQWKFEIVGALQAMRTLTSAENRKKQPRQRLILDRIDRFDGLEKLIVIAVGLDEEYSAFADSDACFVLEKRSRMYRAVTRAQMMVCVVNQYVRGGWLEFLGYLKLGNENAFDGNRDQVRIGAATNVERKAAKNVETKTENETPAAVESVPMTGKQDPKPKQKRTTFRQVGFQNGTGISHLPGQAKKKQGPAKRMQDAGAGRKDAGAGKKGAGARKKGEQQKVAKGKNQIWETDLNDLPTFDHPLFNPMESTLIEGLEELRERLEEIQSGDLRVVRVGKWVQDVSALSKAAHLLFGCVHVTELDISGNSIGDEGASALAKVLGSMQGLLMINFERNFIGAQGAAALAEVLGLMTGLRTLNLGENDLGPGGAASLAGCLGLMTGLRTLGLGDNGLGFSGAAVLAGALGSMTDLQTLRLGGNSFGSKGSQALAGALKSMAGMLTLVLRENSIGSTGSKALAGALGSMTNLRRLNLKNNFIGNEGIRALAEALGSMTAMQTLELGGNRIANHGAKALAKALGSMTSLQSLQLWQNCIGDGGAAILAEALSSMTALQTLDLGRNRLQNMGAVALAPALELMTALRTLNLGHNPSIRDQGTTALAEALGSMTRLETLLFGGILIGDKGASALAEALGSMAGLQTLRLGRNCIGSEARQALRHAIGSSRTQLLEDVSLKTATLASRKDR